MAYKYRNTKTGATFESEVACKGGNWEQVGADAPGKVKPVADPVPEDEEPKEGKKVSK